MIPKCVHRIWFGPPMPEDFRRYGELWKEMHPDWDVRLWTEKNLPALENRKVFDAAPRGDRSRWQSDVARMEILSQFGGVYVDADTEPLRPIDPLLEGCTAFLGWSPNRGPGNRRLVTNATMASAPEHPFIRALIDRLPKRHATSRQRGVGYVTGPWYVDEVRGSQEWDGLKVYPEHVFYPESINKRRAGGKVDTSKSYTWHRWDTARQRDERRRGRVVRPAKRLPYQPHWHNGRTVGDSKRDCVGRYAAIAPHVPKGARVLDFGSWQGYFSHRLASERKANCVAVAPEAQAVHRVKAVNDKIDADGLRALGEFDVALALSVLHHTRPWRDHLEAILASAPLAFIETPHPSERLKSADSQTLQELHDHVTSLGEVVCETGGYNDPSLLRPTVMIRG